MTAELDELLRGQVANWVMRSLIRDVRTQLRTNGKVPPLFAADVMEALAAASGEPVPDTFVSGVGRPLVSVEVATWVTPKEAARRVDRSERQVRRLAANGQILARRFGTRSWQIDIDSLTNVLRSNTS
ncbi:DNA-binding protein [Cryobacterium algoritolerans]|uniref:DNA-binding protein n=1 Tax=Cryobacterium algoritolerans TaxID=1259184 RepID=A0A4R8WX04_9MICO|nr:helix-turn-helix domain-containing protein [Cryobacterium algoritolerans]TFC20054.1 DNA-binding protein [Cryobacterium algoritolerans]